jgi:nucleoside-diphosphate-sugar epimerase
VTDGTESPILSAEKDDVSKVLITGAGGFLGTQLCMEFLADGHQVCAADLGAMDLAGLAEAGCETTLCDLGDRATIEAAIDGCEIVVHAAGLFNHAASRELLFSVNSEGAQLVGEIAGDKGVQRMVLISSVGVYGGKGMGLTEDGPKTPATDYDQSKWDGEQRMTKACAERGLPLAVLRPTLIYGPGSRYGLATWLSVLTLRHHLGLRSVPMAPGGPMGHHVHVEDVARAALLLATHDDAVGGVFNVSDDEPTSAGDLVRMLAAAVGIRITEPGLPWWTTKFVFLIRPIGAWFLGRENPKLAHLWGKFIAESGLSAALTPRIDIEWLDYVLDDHGFDNAALGRLGFTLNHPSITEGMRTTLQWYRERGWLPPSPAKALLSAGSDSEAPAASEEAQAPTPISEATSEPPGGNSPPPSAPPA